MLFLYSSLGQQQTAIRNSLLWTDLNSFLVWPTHISLFFLLWLVCWGSKKPEMPLTPCQYIILPCCQQYITLNEIPEMCSNETAVILDSRPAIALLAISRLAVSLVPAERVKVSVCVCVCVVQNKSKWALVFYSRHFFFVTKKKFSKFISWLG